MIGISILGHVAAIRGPIWLPQRSALDGDVLFSGPAKAYWNRGVGRGAARMVQCTTVARARRAKEHAWVRGGDRAAAYANRIIPARRRGAKVADPAGVTTLCGAPTTRQSSTAVCARSTGTREPVRADGRPAPGAAGALVEVAIPPAVTIIQIGHLHPAPAVAASAGQETTGSRC